MPEYSENDYDRIIGELFVRFPSFQKVGAGAYKPGIDRMIEFDSLLGNPHRRYPTVHVAGTNGKGSVCSMLACVLASAGLKVGLYTSPHISDFRERMRIMDGRMDGRMDGPVAGGPASAGDEGRNLCCGTVFPEDEKRNNSGGAGHIPKVYYIGKGAVLDFIGKWSGEMDRLDLSFFEITTAMAFSWFADENVDAAVIETGLGGRLDSTNIITPVLSVVTNIGYDHCDMLGSELWQIAGEKAGIFKRGIPALVGESHPETDNVFRSKVLKINNIPHHSRPDIRNIFPSDTSHSGQPDATSGDGDPDSCVAAGSLTFADKIEPRLWDRSEEILKAMDLQGRYQSKNLRTVLAAVDILRGYGSTAAENALRDHSSPVIKDALRGCEGSAAENGGWGCGRLLAAMREVRDEDIIRAVGHTARWSEFHGRWERLSETPYIIADIGHNSHGLRYNFAQLEEMMRSGKYAALKIIYGTMADKDVGEIMRLFPRGADCFFVTVSNKRAMPAGEIMSLYIKAGLDPGHAHCSALAAALAAATEATPATGTATEAATALTPATGQGKTLVYIGGSAYLVAEALQLLRNNDTPLRNDDKTQ